MANSMTGYGRNEVEVGTFKITTEMKAVNHRYFEANVKLTRGYAFLEDKVISYLKSRISRGKIEVYISAATTGENAVSVTVNEEFAQSYISALKSLAKKFKLKNDISVMKVASNNDVLSLSKPEINEEEAETAVMQALAGAVDSFIEMRKTEGKRLADDILSRCDLILEKVALIEKCSPETIAAYRERLEQRIKDLLDNVNVDEQRIVMETAILADKVAVDEETVRLKSHISQLNTLLNSDDAVGRKLDFIVQEMNREANTIGSKAQNLEITNTVVDIKAEIEKIREQVQNIE